MNTPFICPHCQSPLTLTNKTYHCPQNHRFDQARQGYVNLTLGHKKRKFPGDSPSMLDARAQFLTAGHYNHLIPHLINHLPPHLTTPHLILDAGCGEGHYLRQIETHLGPHLTYVGLDLSVPALKRAARQQPTAHFAITDLHAPLPLPSH
ncbi:MAG TPA: methyltransferase, partial [Anaerolineae bacterium]|nr:methyltransferase [Anaerolineae bacterium]